MKLRDILERKETKRERVNGLLMTRNRKARNAPNSEIPELDGGVSKATSGLPDTPNVQTAISDLVPHTV